MDSIKPDNILGQFLIEPRLNSKGATGGVKTGEAAKLEKAASEFEALFINHMLKTMRESSMKSDLFGDGKGEELYTSMLDSELSKVMSSGDGIGLKRALMSQLLAQIASVEETSALEEVNLQPIKPVVNNKAALLEFQKHLSSDVFISPVAGEISSGYGLRKDPVTGEHAIHNGVDIKAPLGAPVHPANAGEVVFSGKRSGYGNLIEIRHENGYISRYANIDKLLVRAGDRVNPDDIIAFVGNTEENSGAHLHFETVVEGYAVNPVDLVNFN
jgi:murein DD-endopeptidase MepM/ murein hydrolase activator NlpD